MKDNKLNPFKLDFDSYILQSEPEQQENGKLWQTAIGLQQVDGLTPSKYLYETAKRNIDGEITIEEAKQLIDSYYETRQGRTKDEDDTEEADKVSVRIREILAEKTFSFTPDLLLSIHKRLFTGVFFKVKAGHFRDYNISKREWVLDGESVLYANADMIRQTLDYDFGQEKAFDYSKISKEEAIKQLTRFIANIWQIHPFGEGNTRTTAVFTIKYLNSLGFDVNNEPFEKNSWYFRNALVRANYTNMNKGIYMNTEYLEKFFRN
ncbi:MAG: Fic family protein [Treponema sp.]|uniref:Fic family protein n=1 Tax=Treponema sp. TaxID=166 RepID=UPI001D98373D|nr:Fic family protein [Treponema sp.]MBS7310582.1 Fic family protein [Treponema sp.]